MAEFTIKNACDAPTACDCFPGITRASIVQHSIKGRVLVTCYHGPACMWARCSCTPRHPPFATAGEGLAVDADEARDVAWLSLPAAAVGKPRSIGAMAPAVGEIVTAILQDGPRTATIIDMLKRDSNPSAAIELQLDCTFAPGDSGSPVLNLRDEVVAVVRNECGRCGLVV